MARLIIADLPEDAELDAQAMRAVAGGKQSARLQSLTLERRFRQQASFEESTLVPGLIKTGDLRRS